MQPHPIPQNITGFEFKLIGFLTLRQFGYLGGALILDFVLYSAKLPFIVILFIGGPITLLALALAFLPINSLPFERWLAAFLKTVYSPNTRVWHREPKTIGFLEPQFSFYLRRQNQSVEPKIVADRSKLDSYLASHKKQPVKQLVDINEERRLAQLEFSIPETSGVIFTPTGLIPKSSSITQAPSLAPARFKRMDEIIEK